MQITVELPDEIARQLGAGQDLSRAALEGLVAESCRTHRLSDHQAAELLGLSRHELDGFLKAHGVLLDYSMENFEREAALGESLWQKRQPTADSAGDSSMGCDLS